MSLVLHAAVTGLSDLCCMCSVLLPTFLSDHSENKSTEANKKKRNTVEEECFVFYKLSLSRRAEVVTEEINTLTSHGNVWNKNRMQQMLRG